MVIPEASGEGRAAPGAEGTAFLFPGQGSQNVGMGADLASSLAVCRETFEEADDALGFPLSRLCFEGPEADLTLTANTQPAILTVSVAIDRALASQTHAHGSEIEWFGNEHRNFHRANLQWHIDKIFRIRHIRAVQYVLDLERSVITGEGIDEPTCWKRAECDIELVPSCRPIQLSRGPISRGGGLPGQRSS